MEAAPVRSVFRGLGCSEFVDGNGKETRLVRSRRERHFVQEKKRDRESRETSGRRVEQFRRFRFRVHLNLDE